MRTKITALAAAALLLASAAPAQAAPTVPPLNRAALAAAVADLPNDEVSGALVRVSGPAGSWTGSGGVSRLGTTRPVSPEGRFRIGSATKLLTAATALRLAERGALSLDDTVQRLLPDLLPAEFEPITVRQLLNHTHGIAGNGLPHKSTGWFAENRYRTWDPREVVELGVAKGPLHAPGAEQRYGNQGYLVAGLVIEAVTGRPYADSVRELVIRPLGLRDTYLPGAETRIRGEHSHGYQLREDGTHWDVTAANPTFQWAAAEAVSSARDLDRLINALVLGDLLTERSRTELLTRPLPGAAHGLGVTRIELGGVVLWGKTGDRPGYNSGVAVTEDGARTIAYSVNTLDMEAGELPRTAERIITAALAP
ncbi:MULTISPECIES: serine hydrolase [Actinosynnema]|uniref:serine hydrolase domain-containing protein n=1 Tax=Actinosynnema TaxID=40566 RepID=UPI0020A5C5CF|nr:serine hydrolase domain-containing protein [Actinosynnema pretiosum]MCP2096822.1 D-alanyl-D-alanine carboxypeptidase [Actinosynnema pretiosum]